MKSVITDSNIYIPIKFGTVGHSRITNLNMKKYDLLKKTKL